MINRELERFDPALAAKPQVVAANKVDLVTEPETLDDLAARVRARGIDLRLVSAATGRGLAAVSDPIPSCNCCARRFTSESAIRRLRSACSIRC